MCVYDHSHVCWAASCGCGGSAGSGQSHGHEGWRGVERRTGFEFFAPSTIFTSTILIKCTLEGRGGVARAAAGRGQSSAGHIISD